MTLDLKAVQELAEQARLEYEAWRAAHEGMDPVVDPIADALWNLERAALRVVLVTKAMAFGQVVDRVAGFKYDKKVCTSDHGCRWRSKAAQPAKKRKKDGHEGEA